jgi:hypothetical protein
MLRMRGLLVMSACLGAAVLVTASTAAASPVPRIKVLSNRADLVSGGDALVRVKVPRKVRVARVKLFAGRRNVTKSLERVAPRRLQGLVTDLRDGKTRLVARISHGAAARLAVRNHPIGGPVLAGPQIQPWACQETAEDDQCNEPASFRF